MSFRDEIRAAFTRRLKAAPPLSEARARAMVVEATRAPRRDRAPLAAVATMLLALAVVGGLLFARSMSQRPVPGGSVRATSPVSASPSVRASLRPALTQALDVAADQPVHLYVDPNNPAQLDGITWDGARAGVVGPSPAGPSVVPDAAGRHFFAGNRIFARDGTELRSNLAAKQPATWMDDGSAYCTEQSAPAIGTAGQPATLVVNDLSGARTEVGVFGTVHNQTFVRVLACSRATDRALVVQSGGQGMSTVAAWLVRLSTGAVIWTRTFDLAAGIINLVTTPDAGLVVEVSTSNGIGRSFVLDGAGDRARELPGGTLAALSADRSRGVFVNGWPAVVTLVDLGSGTTIWQAPANLDPYGAASSGPAPYGAAMVLDFSSPRSPGAGPAISYLVGANGVAVPLPGSRVQP